MLKTASRMRQCGIGGWQEQIVTMYGTQIGMVPKGTRAKRSATCSHLFFFFKKRGRWGEGGEERTLCKWINLCCVISLHICWWEQIGVTIPDDGSLSLWCSNSLWLVSGPAKPMWHCPSYCVERFISLYWDGFFSGLSFVIVAFYFLPHELENYCFNLTQIQVCGFVSEFIEMVFWEYLPMVWTVPTSKDKGQCVGMV